MQPQGSKPLTIEVLAYTPVAFFHCQHCEVIFKEIGLGAKIRREQAANAFPPDLLAEYQALSDWLYELLCRYGPRIDVRLVDAASVEGFLKALRYGVRRFPAVIVGGRAKFTGTGYRSAAAAIEAALAKTI
jgi:hypothetical protein